MCLENRFKPYRNIFSENYSKRLKLPHKPQFFQLHDVKEILKCFQVWYGGSSAVDGRRQREAADGSSIKAAAAQTRSSAAVHQQLHSAAI